MRTIHLHRKIKGDKYTLYLPTGQVFLFKSYKEFNIFVSKLEKWLTRKTIELNQVYTNVYTNYRNNYLLFTIAEAERLKKLNSELNENLERIVSIPKTENAIYFVYTTFFNILESIKNVNLALIKKFQSNSNTQMIYMSEALLMQVLTIENEVNSYNISKASEIRERTIYRGELVKMNA